MTPVTPTRRERLRAATLDEIHSVARRLLVTERQAGITLRAISREMGMTAPALYRYYPSLEKLLCGLRATFYRELCDHIESVISEIPEMDDPNRLLAACRAFRHWSIAHPAEFTMMFARPSGADQGAETAAGTPLGDEEGERFLRLYLTLFVRLWRTGMVRVPADDVVPRPLRAEFAAFLAEHDISMPVGAMMTFTSSWTRLYGMVALEVFGHLHFCMTDGTAMFEMEMAGLGRSLGLKPDPTDPSHESSDRPADPLTVEIAGPPCPNLVADTGQTSTGSKIEFPPM